MATVEMSSDELRAQLYTSLRGKGILDSLKSQLRTKLATELQNSFGAVSPRPVVCKESNSQPKCAMSIQVANSIVAEHMKRAGLEYSLSVFLPEAGLNIDKLFTRDDLRHYLRISPSSSLADSLEAAPSEHGFLVQLLEALMEENTATSTTKVATEPSVSRIAQSDIHRQDDSTRQRGFRKPSVDTQLEALENAYAKRAEEESQRYHQSLEDRLTEYQHDLEARYKEQLETEMSLFKTKELAKTRLEERERYQQEALREKEETQLKLQRKLDELRRSELQLKEQYCKKEQDLETSIFAQRQALLAEMDSLRLREDEVKRQSELDKKMLAVDRERLKMKEEELESREESLKKSDKKMSQKYHLELESQLQSKDRELMKLETEYRMDRGRLASSKSDHQVLITELQEERRKEEKAQQLLQEATDRQIALEGQNQALQKQLDQMKDYQQLRQKVSELQQCVAVANQKISETKIEYKRRLSEQKQVVKELQSRNSRPISELSSLQEEIEQLRKRHHKEMLVLEYDNKHLGKQLAVQTEYSLQLQMQLDEQLLQLKSAQREVEDLHSIVEQLKPLSWKQSTKPVSAAGKVKGGGDTTRSSKANPKRQTESTSVHPRYQYLHQSPSPLPSTTHPHTTEDNTAALLALGLPTMGGPSTRHHFSDSSGLFLEDTRATFARLEEEAKELEKTYQSFQHKAVGGESPTWLHLPDRDQVAMPAHLSAVAGYESPMSFSPTTTTCELQLSPPTHAVTSIESLHPKSTGLTLSSLSALPTATMTTFSTAVVSSSHVLSSTQPALATRRSAKSAGTLQPSSLTSVMATAPPTVTAASVADSPSSGMHLPQASLASEVETKPGVTVQETKLTQAMPQQDKGTSSKENSNAKQKVSLDDWWKSSTSSSSILSKNPSATGSARSSLPTAEGQKLKPVTTADKRQLRTPNESTQIADKPKLKLDELWQKSPNLTEIGNTTVSGDIALPVRVSDPPPSTKVVDKPPKISLDDLWKSPSHSQPQTSSAKQTVAGGKQTDKGEDKFRRQQPLEEPKQLGKGPININTQKENKGVELSDHQNLKLDKVHQRTSVTVAGVSSQAVSVEETKTAEEDRRPATRDDDRIDPVMLKYMELVKEKRERQQKSEKGDSLFPHPTKVDKASHSEKDYGVPSLSQVTDSFGGFSDNENNGDPFEDW